MDVAQGWVDAFVVFCFLVGGGTYALLVYCLFTRSR